MTLNGRNVTLAEKEFYGARHNNFNEDRPILSAAKCRSMILVFRNRSIYAHIRGVPSGRGVKYNICYRLPASELRQLFISLAINRYCLL